MLSGRRVYVMASGFADESALCHESMRLFISFSKFYIEGIEIN
jgi:hypothetical protein